MHHAPTRVRAAFVALLLATIAAASPSVDVSWQISPGSAEAVWVGKDLVLLSSQASQSAGTESVNTVQAVNHTQSVVWTFTSVGEQSIPTGAVSFPSIPGLLFLFVNNVQPPNITAVVPQTGAVVWSAVAPFPLAYDPELIASFDGRTLYLVTESPTGDAQLTTLDATTGRPLCTKTALLGAITFTRCTTNSSQVACFAEADFAGYVAFWDSRTCVLLKNISLPTRFLESSMHLRPISANLTLVVSGDLIAVDTTNYTVAWATTPPWPVGRALTSVQSHAAGQAPSTTVVAMSTFGVAAWAATSGELLWNRTAASICPTSSAFGEALVFDHFELGAFPSDVWGADLFSFTASCYYPEGGKTDPFRSVVGAMTAVNGNVNWWRYLSQYPSVYPLLPVGSKAFVVHSYSRQVVEFYDGSGNSSSSFGYFPHEQDPAGSHIARIRVVNDTVVLGWSHNDTKYVTGVTVDWS